MIKYLFNLYGWNINQNINRMQYWWFIIVMISVAIIAGIIQNIFNIRETMDSFIDVLDIILLWPSLVLIIKRCNDIKCNFYASLIIASVLIFAPALEIIDTLIIAVFIVLGGIPSNYFDISKEKQSDVQ